MQTNRGYYGRTAYRTGRVYGVGPTAVKYLVIVLIGIFSVFYLVQSTEGANKVIELRNLEKDKQTLEKDYSALEVNASRLQSIQNLNDYVGKSKMEQVQKTDGTVEVGAQTPTVQ